MTKQNTVISKIGNQKIVKENAINSIANNSFKCDVEGRVCACVDVVIHTDKQKKLLYTDLFCDIEKYIYKVRSGMDFEVLLPCNTDMRAIIGHTTNIHDSHYELSMFESPFAVVRFMVTHTQTTTLDYEIKEMAKDILKYIETSMLAIAISNPTTN